MNTDQGQNCQHLFQTSSDFSTVHVRLKAKFEDLAKQCDLQQCTKFGITRVASKIEPQFGSPVGGQFVRQRQKHRNCEYGVSERPPGGGARTTGRHTIPLLPTIVPLICTAEPHQ